MKGAASLVTVNNVAPTLSLSGAASVAEGSTYTLSLASSDPGVDTISGWTITWGDGDVQTVSGNPVSMTHVYADGDASRTISATDEDGTYEAGNTLAAMVVNVAPTAHDDEVSTFEDSGPVVIYVLPNDSDPAGSADPLTIVSATDGAHGTVVVNSNSTISYEPALDYNGVDEFTYTISDGDGGFATAHVAVTVTAVADIVPDAVMTPEDKPITLNVLTGVGGGSADNFENPGRVVTSVTQGANGTVEFAPDGTLTYSPNLDYFGADSITYTVTSSGVTESATVSVTVLGVQQQLVNIKAGVQTLVDNGSLNSGEGSSLIVKLDGAAGAFAAGKTTAGVNRLNAFINEVSAYVKSRRLTTDEGQNLIDAANAVIQSAQTSSARVAIQSTQTRWTTARQLAFAELGNEGT